MKSVQLLCFFFVLPYAFLSAQPEPFLREKNDGEPVKYFYVEDCDKDGSVVGARVASALCGVAETRTLVIRAGNNLVGSDFLQKRCEETCRYYRDAGLGKNPLLRSNNVVMGSVHELGLYISEVLHAPILPLQFLGFAESMMQIQETRGIKIAMSDYGVGDKFWVWCKVSNREDVPVAYLEVLKKAQNLFLVRSTETEEAIDYLGTYEGCYIHRSTTSLGHDFTRNIVEQLPLRPLADSERVALRQHEWGVPDQTIEAMQRVWVNLLRKSIRNFHVVEGPTVNLFCAVPNLWEEYLASNYRQVEGITLNSYWVAHPTYERRYNLVPFHFYRYKNVADGWAPYDSLIKNVVGRNWNNDRPFIVSSFVNNIGSGSGPHSDVLQLYQFLRENQLWANNENVDQYFCVGMDCTGSTCVSIDQEVLDDIPSTKVRKWLIERNDESADRLMQPMSVGSFTSIASSLGLLRPRSKL